VELAGYKKNGSCRRLVVTGCLPERYREQIIQAIRKWTPFWVPAAFDQIVKAAGTCRLAHKAILPDPDLACLERQDVPRVLSASHLAYLKIAEGCSNRCTYCIIRNCGAPQKPSRGGRVDGSQDLSAAGVKELVLVARTPPLMERISPHR